MPLQGEEVPVTKIIIRNNSNRPCIIKRHKDGVEGVLGPHSVIGLDVYDKGKLSAPFIAIDPEANTIWYDFGGHD
jgi:hypothetical protein